MSDLLQAHADHARTARQAEHRGELRPLVPRVARMADYIAALPDLTDRRLAIAAVREVAPLSGDAFTALDRVHALIDQQIAPYDTHRETPL